MNFSKKNHEHQKINIKLVSKKIVLVLLTLGFILVSFKTIESETYIAVIEDSTITWAGSRPGKTHNGTLSIADGNFVFEGDKLIGGDFTLDMNSIKVLDIKPGKMNQKLVDHFKSADFFDVSIHATGKFQVTGSEAKEDKTLVNGKLTIKGISNDVEFLADVSNNGDYVTVKSDEFKIDRTKWDIKFRSGRFFDNLKDKLIYDDITITVNVKAKK